MKFGIFSIRDQFTGFMSPVLDQNLASAKRNFELTLKHSEGIMNFKPADFDLMYVGVFDSETGEIEPCPPRIVCSGASFVSSLVMGGAADGKDKVD